MMGAMSKPVQSNPTAPLVLLRGLAENWWLLLLRGIATIAFGVLAFTWPGRTLLTLTFLWGVYVIADGIFALWAAISRKGGEIAPRWWLALIGITGIVGGLLAFVWPGITAHLLLMLIAIWAIITGVLEMYGAIRLHREIEVEWMMALSGLLSFVLGITLIARPGAGAVAVMWSVGSFAILVGCIYVSLALWLKRHKRPA
jgi:uncharacterized membrane protein HdeD (DUF308 family)